MRQQNDVFQPDEGGRDVGLVLVYVQTGAGNDAVPQSFGQRRLINHFAAGGGDQKGRALHPAQARLFQHATGCGAAGAMEGDEVRVFQQLIQVCTVLASGARLDFGGGAFARVVENLHAEAVMGLPGGGQADTPEADQSQGFARDIGADHSGGRPAWPLVCADLAFAFAGSAGGHQHQGDGQFGSSVSEDVGGVGYCDAQAVAGSYVDVTEAYFVFVFFFLLLCCGGGLVV